MSWVCPAELRAGGDSCGQVPTHAGGQAACTTVTCMLGSRAAFSPRIYLDRNKCSASGGGGGTISKYIKVIVLAPLNLSVYCVKRADANLCSFHPLERRQDGGNATRLLAFSHPTRSPCSSVVKKKKLGPFLVLVDRGASLLRHPPILTSRWGARAGGWGGGVLPTLSYSCWEIEP